jgi:large subunit ribosomal protein L16
MFEVPNTRKYRTKCKKLLKPKGLKKNTFISPNSVLLKVEENTTLTREQLLRLNQMINKTIKRRGKIRFPTATLVPRTEKSVGVRMGKGKGSVAEWVVSLRRGTVLFEIEGLRGELNKSFLKELNHRLPCSIRMISSHL